MKNKSGFLLAEETLKIIIALISISFLIYFLTSLYSADKEKKELEFAEASLNNLVTEINAGSENVEIYNPEGWSVISWPRKTVKSIYTLEYETIENDIPNSCSNFGWQNCLCICDNSFNLEGKDCDELGICVESDYKTSQGKILIDNPPITLQINEGEINKK